jgi:FMN reductase
MGGDDGNMNGPFRLVALSAGASDPSSTRMLADRTVAQVVTTAERRGHKVEATVVDLRELAGDITDALVAQLASDRLKKVITALGEADGVIVSTPVYKAGASGLLTSFFHVLDNDLLIAKPVLLAATAGTARHALVIDEQLRPLLAFMRALSVPTSVFAATEDWGDTDLRVRIDRAATELVLLMASGFQQQVKDESWGSYQHEFGSAGGTDYSVDLSSDLMKLAAGGSLGGSSSASAPSGDDSPE